MIRRGYKPSDFYVFQILRTYVLTLLLGYSQCKEIKRKFNKITRLNTNYTIYSYAKS